ncbi:hypothetical protein BJ138DRAFT_1163514 [Hygrophoropsis aurantiaca]|uniref:Uncharacterized protein n=1 Tax=Hygrophoropsis aurantiaca TaxID=72124 RepID=A0ACB7ZY40_9AGAM|nr:hypothetical protein BJ138DRAFT_1163514 [Hygrophoropsis aurantiaca]
MMSITFMFPYFSFAIALSTVITILIASRLLLYCHRITKAAGKASGSQYTNITMIVVESSLLYSSCSLLYLGPYIVHNPVDFTFLQIIGTVDISSARLLC